MSQSALQFTKSIWVLQDSRKIYIKKVIEALLSQHSTTIKHSEFFANVFRKSKKIYFHFVRLKRSCSQCACVRVPVEECSCTRVVLENLNRKREWRWRELCEKDSETRGCCDVPVCMTLAVINNKSINT